MSTDPRAENCRGYATEGGLVTGVLLEHVEKPATRYALKSVRMFRAGDTTVAKYAVYDKDGYLQTSAPVMLAWPWPKLEKALPSGNPNNEHMISGGPFEPPTVGPLALYVADAAGKLDSDFIGGLGLPFKQHVCFDVVFVEREAVAPAPTPPTEDKSGCLLGLLQYLVARLQG